MELGDGLTINEWTTVGYVGAATGIDASGNTTRGAVLKSADGNSYVIATNAGVRMQQGNTGLWIADNVISYRFKGPDRLEVHYQIPGATHEGRETWVRVKLQMPSDED